MIRKKKDFLKRSLSSEIGFLLANITNKIRQISEESHKGQSYSFDRYEITYDKSGTVIDYDETGQVVHTGTGDTRVRDHKKKVVIVYDYDKSGRSVGTRKKTWSSEKPAKNITKHEKVAYNALGRKSSTKTVTEKSGVDVSADEVSNIEYDSEGNIISYNYTKNGKGYHVSNIIYYEDGSHQGFIASYTVSDGTETVTYSEMIYDENGNLTSFTKTLPDGTKEYHTIERDSSGNVTEYVIRDENGEVISSFQLDNH